MATSNGQLPETIVDVAPEIASETDRHTTPAPVSSSSSSSSSNSSGVLAVATEETENRCCCCGGCGEKLRNGCRWVQVELQEPIDDLADVGRRCIKKSCTLNAVLDKFPITRWLPKYRWKQLQGDFIAGLTVGLTVIPQGLAYAKVAGLSPEYGLYSAFMGCFIYMIFGTSKDITLGPTAIMSLLTAQFGNSVVAKDPTYAIILSLFSGFIQLGMGILHIGFIVDYISHPVINSFTTAAAITIAWGQVKTWFALQKIPNDFISQVPLIFNKIPETRLWDFLMGLTCIIALYAMKKTRSIRWGKPEKMSRAKRTIKYIIWLASTARNAIVVVLASVVASVLLQYNLNPFTLTGTIKAGLPQFEVPHFTLKVLNHTQSIGEMAGNIGPGLIIVPILGLVETIAIGKAFARKAGYTIDANQELLAVGASNIVGSFVGAYPVTGSFSRTAVNAQSGVMTPAGGIWTAILVLLALAFLTPLFYYIPNAALAGVIIMAVMDMIDFGLVWRLWKIKKIDMIPWIVTFVCSLCIGIEWGIITGIGLSLLFILYPWARPKFHIHLIQLSDDEMVVMTLNQGLVFPGIEYFKDKIYSKALSGAHLKSVVLDFKSITEADFTTVEGMHQLLDDFAKKNKKLVLCNLQPQVLSVFIRAKLKHFEYTTSLDEAIALIRSLDDDSEKVSLADDSLSPAEDEGVPVGSMDPPDIERCAIYNDAYDEEDPTDDETYERNYIVTPF